MKNWADTLRWCMSYEEEDTCMAYVCVCVSVCVCVRGGRLKGPIGFCTPSGPTRARAKSTPVIAGQVAERARTCHMRRRIHAAIVFEYRQNHDRKVSAPGTETVRIPGPCIFQQKNKNLHSVSSTTSSHPSLRIDLIALLFFFSVYAICLRCIRKFGADKPAL